MLADHQVCGLNLPNSRHLSQNIEDSHRTRRIFKHFCGLRTNAFKQSKPTDDRIHLKPEGICYVCGGYSHHAFRESLAWRKADDPPKPLRVDD